MGARRAVGRGRALVEDPLLARPRAGAATAANTSRSRQRSSTSSSSAGSSCWGSTSRAGISGCRGRSRHGRPILGAAVRPARSHRERFGARVAWIGLERVRSRIVRDNRSDLRTRISDGPEWIDAFFGRFAGSSRMFGAARVGEETGARALRPGRDIRVQAVCIVAPMGRIVGLVDRQVRLGRREQARSSQRRTQPRSALGRAELTKSASAGEAGRARCSASSSPRTTSRTTSGGCTRASSRALDGLELEWELIFSVDPCTDRTEELILRAVRARTRA